MAKDKVPRHVGIILDGNRRWARSRGLSPLEGHSYGVEQVRPVVEQAFESGVEFVSLFVFSTENWNRTPKEVKHLMSLFTQYFKKESKRLIKSGVRIKFAGRRDQQLSADMHKTIVGIEDESKDNTKGTVVFCFNYGGHAEIIDGVKKLLTDKISPEQLDIATFEQTLYHPDVPPVDLVIRTSGEQRISGFQLWRLAYAEFIFIDKYWPDFGPEDLQVALDKFAQRERRFGGS